MRPCGRARVRADMGVHADALGSARMHGRVRTDAPCFIPGNFKKDATVRPSHGRPRSHCPIVRPSVQKRPRGNPGNEWKEHGWWIKVDATQKPMLWITSYTVVEGRYWSTVGKSFGEILTISPSRSNDVLVTVSAE
jgi:hypothetical protein